MNINNLGLLNILGTIINEEHHNSEYAIAEFILNHIDEVSSLTINRIVDEAFVSRSAVRRFCIRLGFQNFSELKSSLTDIIFPSNIHLRSFGPIKGYRIELLDGLIYMLRDMNKMITDKDIKYFVKLLHEYENVYVICSNNTSSNLFKFQQELFFAKKVVKLVNNVFNEATFENVSKDSSLLLVISVSGAFARAINDTLKNVEATKILFTANKNYNFIDTYNQMYFINDHDHWNNDIWDDELGLIGKYGITYLFDLISEEYIYTYK